MRKFLPALLLSAAAILPHNSKGQSILVHYWNFNTLAIVDSTPTNLVKADYSRIDVNKATMWYTTVAGTSSAYSSYYDSYIKADSVTGDGQVSNARFGDFAWNALRLRNPSDSMQLLCYIPTTNYKNIRIKYVTETSSSASGMRVQGFDYSTDSGTNWRSSALSITADSLVDTAWRVVTINMNSITDTLIKNNPRLVFRIQFRINNIGTSGNNRIDNFTVEADTITATGINDLTAESGASNYTLFPNPASNQLNVASEIEGAKNIEILDANGRVTYKGSASGKKFTLDVASLSSGVYTLVIHESLTGTTTSSQFIRK